MNSNKNIDEFFRSEFNDFKINPSGKVWSGINKRLTVPRFNAVYRNAFKGFKISPSEHIWRRVAALIWLNKFIHFSPFSFNVYYLGIIITTVVGTIITVNNNPDLNFVHFNSKAVTVDNESGVPDILQVPDYAKQIAVLNLPDNEISGSVISPDYDDTDMSNEVNTVHENVIPDEQKDQTVSFEIEQDLQDQEQVFVQETVISKDDVEPLDYFEPDKLHNKTVFDENKEEIVDNEEVIKNREILPPRLMLNTISALKYSPGWSEYTDFVISEIPYLNPIVYDTVGYNHAGEPIVIEKSWFTIDLFYSPVLYNYSNKLLNSELKQNYDFYCANNKPQLSHYAGIGLSYNYKSFKIESGFSYLQLNETLNQSLKVYDSITYSGYNYFENQRWEYDTTLILDLDEYLTGNIVYIEHVDSCLLYYQDSIFTEYRDTALIDKSYIAENQYHIFDIPLIAGYELKYGNISFTPKAGLITSYLVKREGTAYSFLSGDIVQAQNLPMSKLLFDYYAGLNIQYRVSKNISVFIEPHLRSDINSLYKSSYAISEKSIKYGVKTGLSIKF